MPFLPDSDMGICVRDIAQTKIEPDTCTITVSVREENEKISVCIKLGNERVSLILSELDKVGIPSSSLRQDTFDIEEDMDVWREPETFRERSELKGYVFQQSFEITLQNDSTRISQVLSQLSRINPTPSFKVEYGISNLLDVESNLVEKAMSSARRKAEALAKAGGSSLGKLISARYQIDDRYIAQEQHYSSAAHQARDANQTFAEMKSKRILVETLVEGAWSIGDSATRPSSAINPDAVRP